MELAQGLLDKYWTSTGQVIQHNIYYTEKCLHVRVS